MSPSRRSTSLFLVLASCFAGLLFASQASAFNITRILEGSPEFSTFNDLLNRTLLYQQINSRKTITVLAVANGNGIDELSSKPLDSIRRILSNHVVLDYYDPVKLQKMKPNPKGTTLTTLFQTTGVAHSQQGFINVFNENGSIVFGSAVPGAPHDARLLSSVAAQPYNISVLSISHPIVAPGIDGSLVPVYPPPPPTPEAKAPVPSEAEEPAEADPPTTSDAPAPASASAPDADDAPASAPAEDDKPADQSPPKSSAGRSFSSSGVSLGLFLVGLASLVAAN